MKQMILFYLQFFLQIFFTMQAMEPLLFNNNFSSLPVELFNNIMMLATPIPIEPTKENIKVFFSHLYNRRTVCTEWYTQITNHSSWYGAYFGMLPIHVAALINNIMIIVHLKIDNKVQLYEKDKNGFLLTYYAHKDIKFIIEQYCKPIITYPPDKTMILYEKKIKKIRKKLKIQDRKKFNRFLYIIILENKIHNNLNYYGINLHIKTFDMLMKMKGNINAYDATGYTFLDKLCKTESRLPYLKYLLTKPVVRNYLLNKNNAQKALDTCMSNSNVAAMETICKLKEFNMNTIYPGCIHFYLLTLGMFSTKKNSPIENFLKTLDLNWEINDQKQTLATPLMLLVFAGRKDFVLWLLKEKKVNPNLQNKDGNTALHFAAKTNIKNRKMINLLLYYNANPYIKNNAGKTAADLVKNDFNNQALLRF